MLRSLRPLRCLPALVLLAGCTDPAPTKSTPATTALAGEYRWGNQAGDQPGGLLWVYPESDSTVLFYVDANDGPPTYHLAQVLGRAHLRGSAGTYIAQADGDSRGCRLRFHFAPAAVEVATVPGFTDDCYFGGNFTPDETYRRVSARVPTYVVDGANDTLHFAHLPPDALQGVQ